MAKLLPQNGGHATQTIRAPAALQELRPDYARLEDYSSFNRLCRRVVLVKLQVEPPSRHSYLLRPTPAPPAKSPEKLTAVRPAPICTGPHIWPTTGTCHQDRHWLSGLTHPRGYREACCTAVDDVSGAGAITQPPGRTRPPKSPRLRHQQLVRRRKETAGFRVLSFATPKSVLPRGEACRSEPAEPGGHGNASAPHRPMPTTAPRDSNLSRWSRASVREG